MKRDVICPVCKENLGRFHANASTVPVRNHIYNAHPKIYKKIVSIVEKIDKLEDQLREYGIDHFDQNYFHRNVNVNFENELENTPPMSDEARKALVAKIMKQDD